MLKITVKTNLTFIENINDPITESFEKKIIFCGIKIYHKNYDMTSTLVNSLDVKPKIGFK